MVEKFEAHKFFYVYELNLVKTEPAYYVEM